MTNLSTTAVATGSKMELADVQKYAQLFIESGLASDQASLAEVAVQIMTGAEMGLPPMAAVKQILVLKTKSKTQITFSADLMAQRIKDSGRYNYQVIESSPTRCILKFMEIWNGQVLEATEEFNSEDAKRAGLWVDPNTTDYRQKYSPWYKFPTAMLFCRCLSAGIRKHAPNCMNGFTAYGEEEIKSIDAERNDPQPPAPVTKVEEVNDKGDVWIDPPLSTGVLEDTLQWAVEMTGAGYNDVVELFENIHPDSNGKKAYNFVAQIKDIWSGKVVWEVVGN